MGKPCLLPESYGDEIVDQLLAAPPEVLNTPERYAVYQAARNRLAEPEQRRDFKSVVEETNKMFTSVGKDAFTAPKLSKFLNNAEKVGAVLTEIREAVTLRALDAENEALRQIVIAAAEETQANDQPQVAQPGQIDGKDEPGSAQAQPEQALESSAPSPTLPAAVQGKESTGNPSAGEESALEEPEPQPRPEVLLEPNVLRGTLQFVEFLAKETGDERLSSELHTAITKMVGRDYTNPLIASSQELDKALVRHNTAMRELPGNVLDAVQKRTQAVQDMVVERAVQDSAMLHNAIGEPVQQAWKVLADKGSETKQAVTSTASAIGNLFKSARAVASAAVEVLNDARKDGSAMDQSAALQAMKSHLQQRD